jgi:dihydroneopterin aldolase
MPTMPGEELPFVDYTLIRSIVAEVFLQKGQLLEKFVQQIHQLLRKHVPGAEKIKVAVRKLNPPMEGDIRYAQVCYEA